MLEQPASGVSTARPVARLRQYLTVLRAVIDERTVDFRGEQLTAVDRGLMAVALTGATSFPLYVAAMGPPAPPGQARKSLRWCRWRSPTTSTLRAAAADTLVLYDQIPSYQKVLARESLSSAVELAVLGSPDVITRRLTAGPSTARPLTAIAVSR